MTQVIETAVKKAVAESKSPEELKKKLNAIGKAVSEELADEMLKTAEEV
jgi:hypothetical protein